MNTTTPLQINGINLCRAGFTGTGRPQWRITIRGVGEDGWRFTEFFYVPTTLDKDTAIGCERTFRQALEKGLLPTRRALAALMGELRNACHEKLASLKPAKAIKSTRDLAPVS